VQPIIALFINTFAYKAAFFGEGRGGEGRFGFVWNRAVCDTILVQPINFKRKKNVLTSSIA
jgi:hypothetical protein